MKQNNLKNAIGLFVFLMVFSLHAQQKSSTKAISHEPLQLTEDNQRHFNETGFIRCATVEVEALRKQNNPNIQSTEEFENWLAPLVEARKQRVAQEIADGTYRRAVVNIPIIFHVITNTAGDANDLPASIIQAQINQLNIDFRNLAGSTHPSAADAEINFIPAMVDPSGNPLPEPGIDRVYGYAGAQSQATMNGGIKQATVWDRSLYANIWTANLSGGLLGYAQFPSNSTLPGMPADGGSALTDGVVVLAGSVGSVSNPGTAAPYNLGRTLTHEVGHWIGLRHIWGDTSSCTNDDYCADTPDSTTSNGGCPTIDRCPSDGLGPDMVENYMDYTNDACMNIFTFDQVNRMLTVLDNADGISNLPNSTTGSSSPIISFSTPNMNEVEGTSCTSRDISVPVVIGLGASANATVTFSASGTATNMSDYEILTPSVIFPAGSNAAQNLIIRIYEDAYIETDETVIINMSLNAGGGDAELATNGNETLTLTILDDDIAPNPGAVTTLFSDDFESYTDFIIDGIGDWITIDDDGLDTYTGGTATPTWPNANAAMAYQIFNPAAAGVTNAASGTETRDFDPRSGAKYAAAWAAVPGANPANDDWLVSPVLSLGASGNSVSFWVKAMSNSYGPENYNVGVYVGSGSPTSGADFTLISPASLTAPYGTWTEDTYDLSAYNNQEIRIGIHCISADRYMFMVDDFSVTSYSQNSVQTAINTGGTAAQIDLIGMGSAYAYDSASGNIMANIQNNDSFDYGCANIAVTRAGNGAQMYENPDSGEFVMDKAFNIDTDAANTTGDVMTSFYFTEAEISGWESATGQVRADLYIIREVSGSVEDIVPATLGSYGSTGVTLEGSFTGADGDFYFGPLNAYLSVENYALDNNIGLYPNPTTNTLNISVANVNELPDSYSIYNMLGQVVLSKRIANEADLSINTSSLSNGMYFIKIAKESNQVSLPFIKK
ncbi:T9SS-dependent choice-of-anchor J family protein [Xanthomarina sp. F2636L]|uniref:T9SS-dependent choice-of-anchor J family protein n=1 Tax=Xanthomarina sp. F2636L TaxID=2996018 RepID=UPI00225DF34E|nr:choice-of-anchor J domain-containing protein [Xanthomarina sp. F2636L]MCX7551538.1 choice-of-anchor J domain-containing protein [Xanthomarina sp. F2636L]